MIATLVFVDVKPENVEDFRAITLYNHENSRKEPGNVRFDVLQSREDPTKFTLYEVFVDEEAAAFHKTTEHYNRWRETVAPYMASPRKALPTTPAAFD
ncbi:MAG: antibiotic biosynthesis monooxygenase [Ruminococcaceae bacterium]|nr:antibiotic biosynthesis monooxygenase [Oscillospiraceae bacterium]